MGREHEETGIFVELCTPAKLWMEVTLKWSFEGFLRKSSLCVPLLPTGANQITTHSYFYDYKSHFSHAVETRRTSELPQLIGGKEVLESFEDRDRVHKAQVIIIVFMLGCQKIWSFNLKFADSSSCNVRNGWKDFNWVTEDCWSRVLWVRFSERIQVVVNWVPERREKCRLMEVDGLEYVNAVWR